MTKKMGPKETERFFREGGKDALKDVHKGEPWDSAPLIVEVANPGDHGKIHRFVVVWDNKSRDHKACPFYHHMMKKKTVETDCAKPSQLEVPDKEEREDAVAFVPWEKKEAKECDHDLVQKLFVDRKSTPKKKIHQKKKKTEKTSTKTDRKHKNIKKRTKRSSKAARLDFSCKEDVDDKIRKVLRVKRSTFGRKKTTEDMSPQIQKKADEALTLCNNSKIKQVKENFLRSYQIFEICSFFEIPLDSFNSISPPRLQERSS